MGAISNLSNINNAQQQQSIANASAKLQAVIASLVTGNKLTRASDDVAALSIASQLQSHTAGLRQLSGNLVQASSETQVADGGAAQIQNALGQLQNLASQAASPIVNDSERQQLNAQFQSIAKGIDQIAQTTSFNGQKLLNGDLSGSHALSLDGLLGNGSSGGDQLAINDLSSNSLFGGKSLDLTSAAGASQAFAVIGDALNQVINTRASIGAFQQTVDFASANVDSAIVNQEAAYSNLGDTDIAAASTQFSLDDLQRNAGIALTAQGNRLAPVLLKLIG